MYADRPHTSLFPPSLPRHLIMIPCLSLFLPYSATRGRALSIITRRSYSFESGRNRKPDRSNKPQSSNDKPITETSKPDPKPTITGRGRRHRATSSSSSAHTPARPAKPELQLPFVPLPSDHLAHLRPKVLALDRFFSLQRPLLEIELPISDRRSISAESRLEASDADEPQPEPDPPSTAPESITTGSPSDPAFKPPQMSTGGIFSEMADDGFEDELWGAVDGYAPYLIAEPDGVDPDWPRALKHYLACAPAFVPPPVPTSQNPQQLTTVAAKDEAKPADEQDPIEQRRIENVQFLAPYGTFNTAAVEVTDGDSDSDANFSLAEPVHPMNITEETSLPEISQDSQSLTLQAARFLHAGLSSFRWPSAVEWDSVREKLGAAEASYTGQEPHELGSVGEVGPVRGNEPEGRPATRFIKLTIEAAGSPQILTLDPQQLQRIIEYSETLVKNHLSRGTTTTTKAVLPKELVSSFERLGAFLVHKHRQRQGPMEDLKISVSQVNNIEEEGETEGTVEMDSVQRKRKRKMKVHKYKKRRKARRTLRKRQGRD
ncbi:hypothetical protein CROQUDRAFT_669199 [Cronartium quercuum f. sp. fusiforme G11]|uniref:Ribosomal protein mS38 C-terminal domain-containing protein n=1 Tax=Cronartium quercuum f. sp. fusiforme G11 TaxID=708437 RepID=A0A9P6NU37_9BASI|nr:hypothetical protein CROQUDRAFT_669199 [Cronartium quercuum f. sp. fusiforme G11]